MGKIIVAIEIEGLTQKELSEALLDRRENESWLAQDGKRILIDNAYLREYEEENSFYAFEYRGFEE